MAANKDWISMSYEGLYSQSTLTKDYLDGHLGDLGINGKTAEWVNTDFKTKAYQPFANAVLAWRNPAERTPLKITAVKEAFDALVPVYRELYTFLKGNPVVTDQDLQAMGLPKRSSNKPTPVPPPQTVPEAVVELPSEGVVVLHFRDSGSDRKGKPAGIHGVEIAWRVGATAATLWDELTNSAFDTATPYRFSFPSEERGKTLSFALRWENTRGEKGAWSQIYTAIIP
ncbi:MAG: hypothetical protein LBN27_08505 [Prevotellaceae bacterium]|jgi:hypothetical protein|nr:hypothetical protein [Prevotellaceae bacterium]